MKYAQEIIEMMGAYPNREFKMAELVSACIGKGTPGRERNAARRSISRVLLKLEENKSVRVNRMTATSATYRFGA